MDFKIPALKVGMTVEGTVIQVNDDAVYVDISQFTEGVIYTSNLTFDKVDSAHDVVKVGDTIKAKVRRIDRENSMILLSRLDILRDKNQEEFDKFVEENDTFEAKVTRVNKGGLILRAKGVEVFMPASHIALEHVNPEDFKGQTMKVKLIENSDKKTVVSRKKVLLAEQREAKQEEFDKLEVGQKVDGEVTNITNYGAFVKIGYNEGLVHISEISHHHVKDVNEYLKVGEKITAEIIDLKKNRIALSMKKLQKSPWDTFAEEHKVGETIEGTIVKKMAKGILVEVAKDVVGILNSKDYSWNPHENFAGEVEVGDKVSLQILSIDPKKQRMSLSKKHLDYNPWADVTVKKGEEVSGVVEEIQSKGALVKIQNVKAFLPISEIQSETPREVSDALSVDDVIKAVVIDLDKRMWKMVLSVKQLKEQKEKNEYEKYLNNEEETKAHTLGDLFKEELENYKK